jgi:hypothetical protein
LCRCPVRRRPRPRQESPKENHPQVVVRIRTTLRPPR